MANDPKQPLPPPPGWATDSLSEYLELASRNRYATFVRKERYKRLARIDAAFVAAGKDWLNPKETVPALLFYRSHSAFRAACQHSLAGQVADTFPQVRASLEYAGYALHIHKSPAYEEMWLRRHDSDASLSAVKRAFQVAKVKDTIRAANVEIGKVFEELYNRAIDFGGHPNEMSVTSNLSMREIEPGRTEIQQVYMHGDGIQLVHALKTTAQAGVCALSILGEVFTARFELLGIRAQILELRQGL